MTDQLGRVWWWVTHLELGLPELLGILTALIGAVTLLIVLIQLRLMRRQTSLMEVQTQLSKQQVDIVKKQDEILSAERARRAVLEIKVDLPAGTHGLSVSVENSGTKTAPNFYWHLLVPQHILQYENFKPEGTSELSSTGREEIEGVVYSNFSDFVAKPLYPTRLAKLGHFITSHTAPSGKYWMRWSTVSEDGANPPETDRLNRSAFTIGTTKG